MANKQRPWWLFAMQMPLLDTILREDHQSEQKRFIIEGQPVIKNLSWITYGPIAAVLTLLLVGAATWMLGVNGQAKTTKLAFACLLGLSPLIAWAMAGAAVGKISQVYINRQIKADAQRAVISLGLNEKALQLNESPPISFDDIEGFKLISDSGVYYSPGDGAITIVNLVMNTKQGQITLLPKKLGSLKQKLQLVSQLENVVVVKE